MIKSLIAMN